jgi:hypothetical protein
MKKPLFNSLSTLLLLFLLVAIACNKSNSNANANSGNLNITGKWKNYFYADWLKFAGTDSVETGGHFTVTAGAYINITSNGLWINYDPSQNPPFDTTSYKTVDSSLIILGGATTTSGVTLPQGKDTLHILKYSTDTLLYWGTLHTTDVRGYNITEYDTIGLVRQ